MAFDRKTMSGVLYNEHDLGIRNYQFLEVGITGYNVVFQASVQQHIAEAHCFNKVEP